MRSPVLACICVPPCVSPPLCARLAAACTAARLGMPRRKLARLVSDRRDPADNVAHAGDTHHAGPVCSASPSARSASSTATSARARCTPSARRSSTHDLDGRRRRTRYGVASIVFWALVIIISIKYLALVMRADNHGEGGILALTALLMPQRGLPTGHDAGDRRARRVRHRAALRRRADHAGDLGAQRRRGLRGGHDAPSTTGSSRSPCVDPRRPVRRAAPRHRPASRRVFGPVMVVWFAVIGVLGLRQIIEHPGGARGGLPGLRGRVLRRRAGQGVPRARLDLPRRHRRRGAVRRHGPLRPPADPARRGTRSCSRRCCSTTSARPRCCSADPEAIESPFYRLAPTWAVTPLACWRRWPR